MISLFNMCHICYVNLFIRETLLDFIIYYKSEFFRPVFIFAIFASGFKNQKFERGEQLKNSKLGLELAKSWLKFKVAKMSEAAKRRK